MKTALALILAALLAVAASAWSGYRWGTDRANSLHAEKLAEQQAQARAREQALMTKAAEVARDAQAALDAIRAAAARAEPAAERLRVVTRTVAAQCPSPAAPGLAASAPGDLLADVQRRLDEAAGDIGRFADLAHAAGLACQRIQTLTP